MHIYTLQQLTQKLTYCIHTYIIEYLSLIMVYNNQLLTWDIPPNHMHYCTRSFYNRPPSCWGYESTRTSKTLSTQVPLISQLIHLCNHPNHQLSFPLQSEQPKEVDPLLCNAVPRDIMPLSWALA
jgi:hypothetical protein